MNSDRGDVDEPWGVAVPTRGEGMVRGDVLDGLRRERVGEPVSDRAVAATLPCKL